MQTLLRVTALVVLVLGIASQASAADKQWHVTGVISDGLATVFTCTNGSTAPVQINVTVYKKDGTVNVAGSLTNIAPQATVNFATKPIIALPSGVDLDLGAVAMHSGSAIISAPSKVYCTSYVVDPAANPPGSMMGLPVFKKTNQKGD